MPDLAHGTYVVSGARELNHGYLNKFFNIHFMLYFSMSRITGARRIRSDISDDSSDNFIDSFYIVNKFASWTQNQTQFTHDRVQKWRRILKICQEQ